MGEKQMVVLAWAKAYGLTKEKSIKARRPSKDLLLGQFTRVDRELRILARKVKDRRIKRATGHRKGIKLLKALYVSPQSSLYGRLGIAKILDYHIRHAMNTIEATYQDETGTERIDSEYLANALVRAAAEMIKLRGKVKSKLGKKSY